MEAQAPRRCQQSGGSRRPLVHLRAHAAEPMAKPKHDNAIERLHEEFQRRIKTQTVLPSADTAAMMFWALLASGQISMRKVDGWQTLATKPSISQLTLPPETITSCFPENSPSRIPTAFRTAPMRQLQRSTLRTASP